MPVVVKIFTFEQMVQLTKNMKLFYYSGRIMSFADVYEQFIFFIGTETLDEENKIVSDINLFIEERFKSKEEYKQFFFRCTGYSFCLKHFGLLFAVESKYNEVTPIEHYPIVEKIDHIMFEYVKKNNLNVLNISEHPEYFEELTKIRKFDPRNPDPHNMFLVQRGEKPTPRENYACD